MVSRRAFSRWIPGLTAALGIAAASGCATDVSGTRLALLRADREFAAYTARHGFTKGFLRYLAPDAFYLPARARVVRGRRALRAYFAGAVRGAGPDLRWQPAHAEAARSGELGYTWGRYQVFSRGRPPRRVLSRGKYVSVWRRQADGSWRVIADIGNPSPPPKKK